MVVVASTGLADILVCALAAAFLMVLTGCLQLRDAYRAMDGRVLLIIIAMIGLSAALEKTGASEFYARAFLNLLRGLSPAYILSGVLLLTSISTHVLSNNATVWCQRLFCYSDWVSNEPAGVWARRVPFQRFLKAGNAAEFDRTGDGLPFHPKDMVLLKIFYI
jgi:hypothetical protein